MICVAVLIKLYKTATTVICFEVLPGGLVCGVGDDRTQNRLLLVLDLTFDKVLKLAKAFETPSRDVKDWELKILFLL